MKRIRRETAAHAGKRAWLETDCATFMPKEVLAHVAKFLSRCTNARNSETYIPLRSVAQLFGVRGGLANGLKTRFNTLCISRAGDCSDEDMLYGWKLRQEGMAWTNNIRVALEFILGGGGHSIKTLIVGDRIFDKKRDAAKMVDDFHKYCPNVTSSKTMKFGLGNSEDSSKN